MSAPGGLDPLRSRLLALMSGTRYPIAPAQQQMLAAVDPAGLSRHTDLVAARLDGPLDGDALWRALDALARAHEALRTHFTVGAAPAMVVRPPEPADLVIESVDRMGQAAQRARELLGTPVDLTAPAPHRAVLLSASATSHVLLVPLPHLLCDAYSHGVYLTDLTTALRGQDLPARTGYGTYAVEQADLLADGAALGRRIALLSGPRPPMSWPRTPDRRRYRQIVVVDHWAADWLDNAVRRLEADRTTLTMACAAAWAAALHVLTGATDVRIGTSLANRADARFAHTVGLFATMSVLRLAVHGELTVAELRARGRRTTVEALSDGHVPLGHVLAALRRTEPGFRGSSLYEATLTFVDHAAPVPAGPDTTLHAVDGFDVDEGPTPAFQPVQLAVRKGPPGIGTEIRLGFDGDLLGHDDARTLLALTRSFVSAEPHSTVAEVTREVCGG